MNTRRADTATQQRLVARKRANKTRNTRAELKRRLRAGEVAVADVILQAPTTPTR